jgi:hypothetical protein
LINKLFSEVENRKVEEEEVKKQATEVTEGIMH